MRFTEILHKYSPRVRYTDKEHEVQFKLQMPLTLRNFVSGKRKRSLGKNCIQEMNTMMACLKKGDFEQIDCGREIRAFRQCSANLNEEVAERKRRERKTLTHGKDLSLPQLNAVLKKYPQKYDAYDQTDSS